MDAILFSVYNPRVYASAKETYANAFPWSLAKSGLYVNHFTKSNNGKDKLNKPMFSFIRTKHFFHVDAILFSGLGFIVPAGFTVRFWHRTKSRKIDRLYNVEAYNPRACASEKKKLTRMLSPGRQPSQDYM